MIQVLQLGLVEYNQGLEIQRALVERRKAGTIADTLLLLEHPPVITLGRNAKPANILISQEQLAQRGVQVIECDRGGDVTYHGPGQLVGYPIFDLRGFTDAEGKRKTLGPVEFVRRMEEALIRTCGDLGVPCGRIAGLTGVWTENSSQKNAGTVQAKIAAIGVHISRGITSHGFALNVTTDLDAFQFIVPCGIHDRPVTSLQRELAAQGEVAGAAINMNVVAHAVARNFGRVFQRQTLWLENLRALLGAQPQDTPLKVPAEVREIQGDEELFLA